MCHTSARISRKHVRYVQEHGDFAPLGRFDSPTEKLRPNVPRARLETGRLRKIRVDARVHFPLQLEVELVEQRFFVREVREKTSRRHTRAFRNAGGRRGETVVRNFVNGCVENGAAFRRTFETSHRLSETVYRF